MLTKRKIKIVFILVLWFSTFISCIASDSDNKKRIFILHSYEIDHVCGRPQSMGAQRAILESGYGIDDVVFQSYAMDTKKNNHTPELIAEQAKISLQKIEQFKPDILVTLDDNAFSTVALKLVDSPIQIVFSGMNNIPERYNKHTKWLDDNQVPSHNITGVYEKIHFATAVKVQKNIQPEMKKIRVFSDNSPTGQALVRQVKREIESSRIPAIPEFFITDSWEQYQQKLLETNESDIDTLYPIALRLIDKSGRTYTGSEILTWTSKNSIKPSIPLNFAFVKLGLLGGAGVDFEYMGYQAGKIAVRILSGEKASDIPIEEAERHALVFNVTRAKSLGIEIPADILLAADEIYK